MQHEISESHVVVTLTSGAVALYVFQMLGRHFGPGAEAAGWRLVGAHKPGLWMRTDSDANIEHDIRKYEREQWNKERRYMDGTVEPAVQIASWRRITKDESQLFSTDRTYRSALRDVDGKIVHDMDAARDLHRKKIRHHRASALPDLDGQWMRAVGQGRAKTELDAIEAKRQAWRDAPNDPRIDAAKSTADLAAIQLPK